MKKEKKFITLLELSQSIAVGGKMPCSVSKDNGSSSYIVKTRGTIFGENRSNKVVKIEKMI